MSEPARKIRRSATKNIHRVAVTKVPGCKDVLLESYAEAMYCLHLQFNDDVVAFQPQPETFALVLGNGQSCTYTPDFRVLWRDGAVTYVEVKPNADKHEGYLDEKFKAFREFLETINSAFEIKYEEEICAEPLLSNMKLLYPHRLVQSLDRQKLATFAGQHTGHYALGEILAASRPTTTTREVYVWLAQGFLRFDFSKELLTTRTEVWFDAEA